MRHAVLLIFLTSSCLGQQFIKGGLTLAHSTGLPPDGVVRRLTSGFTIGFAFNRQLTERTFFRPEIAFVQKGERFTTSTEVYKANFNYLEVPVLFVWSLMKEPHTTALMLEAGPSFGYGVGGKYTVANSSQSRGGAVKFGDRPAGSNPNNMYLDSPIDIAMQFGIAVIVRQRLMFNLRYGAGLTSFTDAPDPLPSGTRQSDYYTYTRTFQLTVAWARSRKD
jgi:hypothetical protein